MKFRELLFHNTMRRFCDELTVQIKVSTSYTTTVYDIVNGVQHYVKYFEEISYF